MVITYRERAYDAAGNPVATGPVLLTGDFVSHAAAAEFAALNSVSLAFADLRSVVWDGANLSGLWAPNADLRGASLRNVRMTGTRQAELSAALLQGCVFDGSRLTNVNLACTQITSFLGVQVTEGARLRGVNWTACPHVIVTPIKDGRVGKVVAVLDRDLTTWRLHAGETKGARTAAEAETQWVGEARYAEGIAWWRDDAVARQKRIDIAGRPDSGVLAEKSGGERTNEPGARPA